MADECPTPTLPLCRHYLRGLCLYMDKCRFVHCPKAAAAARATAEPTAEEAARQHAIDAATLLYQQTERTLCKLRQSGARPASSAPMRDALAQLTRHRERCKTLRASGGTPTGQRLSRFATRHRVRNKERAGALRRFLIETYGLHALAAGGGVVDVAGGQASLTCNFRPFPPIDHCHLWFQFDEQGALAFELLNLNNVSVTVVDPRPMTLRRLARKWEKGLYFRTQVSRSPHFPHMSHPMFHTHNPMRLLNFTTSRSSSITSLVAPEGVLTPRRMIVRSRRSVRRGRCIPSPVLISTPFNEPMTPT